MASYINVWWVIRDTCIQTQTYPRLCIWQTWQSILDCTACGISAGWQTAHSLADCYLFMSYLLLASSCIHTAPSLCLCMCYSYCSVSVHLLFNNWAALNVKIIARSLTFPEAIETIGNCSVQQTTESISSQTRLMGRSWHSSVPYVFSNILNFCQPMVKMALSNKPIRPK